MFWFTTPDQILIRDRKSEVGKEKDNDSKRSPSYDFTIDAEQTICSICKRSDKMITDPESGEVICSSCGVVLLDRIEDISRSERRVFGSGARGMG
ncbi:MAG: hypothetical protein JO327_10865, partial [Nitrososphaeraceae archaeon]|nr:hypothetical protein [Nitrososphaeraceae archaeon]